jgi:hypothetical protein
MSTGLVTIQYSALEGLVATYTRLESPDTPPEPRFAVGRRPAVAGEPRSRWETVLASGFVDERHASSACVARRVHGS